MDPDPTFLFDADPAPDPLGCRSMRIRIQGKVSDTFLKSIYPFLLENLEFVSKRLALQMFDTFTKCSLKSS